MAFTRLRHERTGSVVAERAVVADTFFARVRGLLGRRAFAPGEALVILPCNSVHMLGMMFSIDVLFCRADHLVLHVEHNLRPWRFSPMIRNAYYVAELPAGEAARLDIRAGDHLLWETT